MSALAWILVAAVAASLVVAAALILALRRAHARTVRTEELVTAARRSVRGAAEDVAATQSEQLRVSISRAHADALSAYATEQRRLSDERRGELAVRERELSERLAQTLAEVERRVEERLRAWEADLERAQRTLDGQVTVLENHQQQRIADVQGRLDAEAAELGTTADHQRAAAIRLREELEHSAKDALAEALDQLSTQAADQRRVMEDISDRLRQREQALNDQIDRAESEARSRLEIAFAELERRQVDQLDRAVAREVDRLSEAGALEFEARMRAIREESATRLQHELDRTTEALFRRANLLIADQFQQVVEEAAQRLEARIDEATRRYEGMRSLGGA